MALTNKATRRRNKRFKKKLYLNTISLEDWKPKQPNERWCAIEIVDQYLGDNNVPRVNVRILEGPEKGRTVFGLSKGSLRYDEELLQARRLANK
jgi:ribosomal protein S28E/S33